MHLKSRLIYVPVGRDELRGSLTVPEKSNVIVVLSQAHSHSFRDTLNEHVAEILNHSGIATLLIDLLTPDEQLVEFQEGMARADVELLASRLSTASQWLLGQDATKNMRLAYFAAGDSAAASLICAARLPAIQAMVCCGGRPDLAGRLLARVHAPTLLIVGGNDRVVVEFNNQAAGELGSEHRLEVIPNASQLFQESGALETVAALTRDWFEEHLIRHRRRAA